MWRQKAGKSYNNIYAYTMLNYIHMSAVCTPFVFIRNFNGSGNVHLIILYVN
jgi:hypothetical protein